jgi:hypothetical protein
MALNWFILVLGVLNLLALVWLGLRTVGIANRAVDLTRKDIRRRRIEQVGELVIRVYLAMGVAPKAMTDHQVRLHVALTGLEEDLPTCKRLAWTDHSPAGANVAKSTWQAALDEVKDALRLLD